MTLIQSWSLIHSEYEIPYSGIQLDKKGSLPKEHLCVFTFCGWKVVRGAAFGLEAVEMMDG